MVDGTADRDVAVLEHLRRCSATRPQIADATQMSKPTVSAAIATLEHAGLVREDGQITGATGRRPTVYTLNNTAGLVIGIDIGGANTRVALADLRGDIVAERAEPTGRTRVTDHVMAMVGSLFNHYQGNRAGPPPPLVAAVLSTPGVGTDNATVRFAYNVDARGSLDFRPLAEQVGAPLRVENNVNLAAIGEHRLGAAQQTDCFIHVSVGAGIGLGIIHDGRLLRGAHGAAGEISYMPLGPSPADQKQTSQGYFESETAAQGLLARAQSRDWRGHAPRSVAELFEWAALGDAIARDIVADEGRRIGLAVATACAMVDPELVVLGGGIGRNTLLLEPVATTCAELLPVARPIVTTQLADRASLIGAVVSAADDAWQRLTTYHAQGQTLFEKVPT